ncbi:hypothetical protein ACJX0J_040469 [Zea mays]
MDCRIGPNIYLLFFIGYSCMLELKSIEMLTLEVLGILMLPNVPYLFALAQAHHASKQENKWRLISLALLILSRIWGELVDSIKKEVYVLETNEWGEKYQMEASVI